MMSSAFSVSDCVFIPLESVLLKKDSTFISNYDAQP